MRLVPGSGLYRGFVGTPWLTQNVRRSLAEPFHQSSRGFDRYVERCHPIIGQDTNRAGPRIRGARQEDDDLTAGDAFDLQRELP